MHGSFDHREKGGQWALMATATSVTVALVLVLVKLFAWQRTGSVAMLGSLADSGLDVAASIIAFIGVRMAQQPPDDNHRFGHEKAEAVSSLVQLVLITGAAVFVAVESVHRFINPEPVRFGGFAIGVMVFSIVLTMILISIQTIAVRKSGSIATESDRAHYIGDLASNAGTLIAIVAAAKFGWLRADSIAGLMTAFILGYAVLDIAKRALPQLLDEELGQEVRDQIREIALAGDKVVGIHGIRTRQAGSRRYIQLHLEFPGDMTLDRVHIISDQVEDALHKAFPDADVMIHQDPENDQAEGAL